MMARFAWACHYYHSLILIPELKKKGEIFSEHAKKKCDFLGEVSAIPGSDRSVRSSSWPTILVFSARLPVGLGPHTPLDSDVLIIYKCM